MENIKLETGASGIDEFWFSGQRGERVFSMEIFKNRCQNRMDKWGAVEGATHIREEAMYCSVEKMC